MTSLIFRFLKNKENKPQSYFQTPASGGHLNLGCLGGKKCFDHSSKLDFENVSLGISMLNFFFSFLKTFCNQPSIGFFLVFLLPSRSAYRIPCKNEFFFFARGFLKIQFQPIFSILPVFREDLK